MIYYSKGYKAKSAKEVSWANHRKPGATSKSSLPVKSHRTCLFPSATSYNMCEVLSTKVQLIRDAVPGFYWRLIS